MIAANYNAASAPVVSVWRPSIPVAELNNVIDWTAGVNGFQTLSVAKQNTYFALTQGGSVDATQLAVQAGFGAIFPVSVATALAALAKVPATKFQALFTNAGLVCSVFGQTLTPDDVQKAMV